MLELVVAPSGALDRFVGVLAEDAIFVLASGELDRDALAALPVRRAAAYELVVKGQSQPRMLDQLDAWLIALARAMAPVAPPTWIPMMEVIREKVTLEIGARGIRSLFSTKPSEKDVARVKRYGALAVRTLRAVLASDGPLDAEERTAIAAVVASLGLPEVDGSALAGESVVPLDTLDIYGDIEPSVARALVRGAWFAAASDGIDPREEQAVRLVARKVGVAEEEIEAGRREAVERVETRGRVGAAAVDGLRFVLSDRHGGVAAHLATCVGALMVPRRTRSETLAPIGHGAPVTLAGRHDRLNAQERQTVLGIAWAAALLDDPTVGRKALMQARWERFAADLGEDDPRPRETVDRWMTDALVSAARGWA